MNDFVTATRGEDRFDVARHPMSRPSFPPNRSDLVESYRQDALDGFVKERPPTNPMNHERIKSSVLVDLKDSVQVHLLTENALSDSKEYAILSEEEVDRLKKQCHTLTQKIEHTRSNLTIQSKYRDAAISMTRLYSPSGRRRSLLGNRLSEGSDAAAQETEAEREAVQRKCEDLAAELWSLEQRLMEPQRKLLEHTAGILQHAQQMRKKASATSSSKIPLVNGVPASPESMYTTSNGRNSLDFLEDGFVFDEASLYRSFDMAEIINSQPRQNAIGIPLKSPVREQNKQLVEETDKLRQENEQLQADNEALTAEVDALRQETSDQRNLMSDTEQKLESINHRLREAILKSGPTSKFQYDDVPALLQEPGAMLDKHLEYLENGLSVLADTSTGRSEVARQIEPLCAQIQDMMGTVDASFPQAPSTNDIDHQIRYLQESLRLVDGELERAAAVAQSTSASKQKSEQSEAVLMGLWDIIQSGYADIRQRKQERRNARIHQGLELDEDDLSDGESIDVNEPYSLTAFASKIQWLYTQATRLNEQKSVLKRQIKQQRELNSKSDSEKDQQIHDKTAEVEAANAQWRRAEEEVDKARSQLSQAYKELEGLQNGRQEEAAAIEESRQELKQRNAKIASLEADLADTRNRLSSAEASIQVVTAQLNEANAAKSVAEKAIEEKQDIIKAKEQELEQMTGMVAELKMETAMTKAELDGAYGSRKQRAAEVAALHNTSVSAKMQTRVESLEQELEATANDLTDVVRQSLESEKKIGELEKELDKVRAERDRIRTEQERINEDLERQLHEATSDLEERMEAEMARLRKEKELVQDELDKERLKGGSNAASPAGVSKTSYLTDSYRLGLRAERKKYEEQLRAEQMLRRRVEDELRALKRAQGPGKSSLSPR
ncbi:hypothetical protein F5Y17DRAFT_33223 [Xylariaceae sp. FL0594]|nr:hypothetical protein F5Y17DRAFT_33223 [Xylariaceae sp. FL0594]